MNRWSVRHAYIVHGMMNDAAAILDEAEATIEY